MNSKIQNYKTIYELKDDSKIVIEHANKEVIYERILIIYEKKSKWKGSNQIWQ